MKKALILLLLCASLSKSDEVYFKSKSAIRNVVVTDTLLVNDELSIKVKGKGFVRYYKLDDVLLIRKSDVDLTEFPSISVQDELPKEQLLPLPKTALPSDSIIASSSVSRPNLKLLPISIIAFGLTWDFFADASDIGDSIEQINKANAQLPADLRADTSHLQAVKTRKTVLGIACAVVGVINTFVSLSPVEIKATSNSLTVNYNF
jgi:hypothetical protein